MAEQNVDEYLTGAEFAERARVSLRAVRRWADKGVGPKPIRPSGSRIVRYRRSEVEKWLNGDSATVGAAR